MPGCPPRHVCVAERRLLLTYYLSIFPDTNVADCMRDYITFNRNWALMTDLEKKARGLEWILRLDAAFSLVVRKPFPSGALQVLLRHMGQRGLFMVMDCEFVSPQRLSADHDIDIDLSDLPSVYARICRVRHPIRERRARALGCAHPHRGQAPCYRRPPSGAADVWRGCPGRLAVLHGPVLAGPPAMPDRARLYRAAARRVTVLLLSNLGTFVIGYVSYVSCMYFACILHVS